MPSPNGAALAFNLRHTTVLAGCLRNAAAVAREASRLGRSVAVIAAGEQWPAGELRPCLEDWVGAGAIVSQLPGTRSPEAEMAAAVFARFRGCLAEVLLGCGSGIELIRRGFQADVEIAAQWNVSTCAPSLVEGAFVAS
jgi:2-phosphosulfolactate phosphatase